VRWIIDAQLPPVLAELLRQRGHEAEHVGDAGLLQAEDNTIWQRALADGAVIITKDEDFPIRASASRSAPCIVWLRLGNASRRALLAWLEPRLPAIEARVEQGEKLIEVR
jgi:predicted nuclease of predicted toxin-antitoxin system